MPDILVDHGFIELSGTLTRTFISLILQCQNYSKGLISGSLCGPLCDTKEIQFDKCLGHGIKLHVLRAIWKGNRVILKTPKVLGSRSMMMLETISSKPLNNDFKMTREEFMMRVSVFKWLLH